MCAYGIAFASYNQVRDLVYFLCMEKEKNVKKMGEDEEIDVGDSMVTWDTWEFPPNDRSRGWDIISALIAGGLIVYAVATKNYLFAILVLLMGVTVLINSLRRPKRIVVHVTTIGVVVGQEFYPFKDMKDFSIVYNPPEVKILYIDFNNILRPLIAIPIEDANPNDIRENLLPYVFENLEREDEDLTDLVRRVYKL